MPSVNRDFTFLFPIWMPFISSSCLIALARTYSAVLNRSGKSEHPCLAVFRENAFNLSPLRIMMTGAFIYGLHYVKIVSSIPKLLSPLLFLL